MQTPESISLKTISINIANKQTSRKLLTKDTEEITILDSALHPSPHEKSALQSFAIFKKNDL